MGKLVLQSGDMADRGPHGSEGLDPSCKAMSWRELSEWEGMQYRRIMRRLEGKYLPHHFVKRSHIRCPNSALFDKGFTKTQLLPLNLV